MYPSYDVVLKRQLQPTTARNWLADSLFLWKTNNSKELPSRVRHMRNRWTFTCYASHPLHAVHRINTFPPFSWNFPAIIAASTFHERKLISILSTQQRAVWQPLLAIFFPFSISHRQTTTSNDCIKEVLPLLAPSISILPFQILPPSTNQTGSLAKMRAKSHSPSPFFWPFFTLVDWTQEEEATVLWS